MDTHCHSWNSHFAVSSPSTIKSPPIHRLERSQSAEQPTPSCTTTTAAAKSAREWLFPNQRVSISRIEPEANEAITPNAQQEKSACQRRIHFGFCERVEYDRDTEDDGNGGEEERENIDPSPVTQQRQKQQRQQRRRASIPALKDNAEQLAQMEEPKAVSIKMPPAAVPVRSGRIRALSSPSILSLAMAQQEGKEGAVELVDGAKSKYNAVLFRLMSSLCTSKM